MSDVSQHFDSEFYDAKKNKQTNRKKEKKRNKENCSNFVISRFEAGLRLPVKTCLVSFEAFCFIFIIIIYNLCELVISHNST